MRVSTHQMDTPSMPRKYAQQPSSSMYGLCLPDLLFFFLGCRWASGGIAMAWAPSAGAAEPSVGAAAACVTVTEAPTLAVTCRWVGAALGSGAGQVVHGILGSKERWAGA